MRKTCYNKKIKPEVIHMTLFSLVVQKIKAFRMPLPSLILLALASYRSVTSGDSIQLVGICASFFPFFCQFKNFPKAEEGVSAVEDVLSSYIMNLVLMTVYLAWMLLLTWIGKTFVPSYAENPYFVDMLFIAIGADIVFISSVIPVCRELKPMQRLIPGLGLFNAMLIFMMMADSFVKTTTLTNIPLLVCGFSANIMVMTLGLIFIGNREKK